MELTWRGLAAAAITLNFGCSTHFRGDGGSLSVGLLQKIPCTNREVVLCIKNVMKGLLEVKECIKKLRTFKSINGNSLFEQVA